MFWPVHTMGSYTIEGEIAGGGMGIVHRGRSPDGTPVAIKMLRPEFARAIGPDRFLKEIAILRGLHHANIVSLVDAGAADGLPYLVMPLLPARTLRDAIEAFPEGLPVDEVLSVARDVGAALEYAHGHGILHRDIKPENILRADHGWVVADFGLARAVEVAAGETFSSSGLVLGTHAYMSPEQADASGNLLPASDIYSLGCVLYEMLTGLPPFTGNSSQAVVARHLRELPAPIRPIRPDVPEHVEAGVLQMLAKRPEQRPAVGARL